MLSSIRKELASSIFDTLHSKLTDFQLDIWDELKDKGSCGLSLPMGSGKTLLGLLSAMKYVSEWGTPALVQCEKALAPTWMGEMKKFSPGSEKYVLILGSSWGTNNTLEIKDDTLIVVSAGHGPRISYNDADFIPTTERLPGAEPCTSIEDVFCAKVGDFQKSVEYRIPEKPFRNYPCIGNLIIHAVHWSVMIVDESQKYYNIANPRSLARGICSVCARNVIALSGTMLAEPKIELLFGFAMLTRQDIPKTLPLFKNMVYRKQIKPISEMCVIRKENKDADTLELDYKVISTPMSKHEKFLYNIILESLGNTAKSLDRAVDTLEKKELNTKLLVLIGYMRQLLLSSTLCLDSMAKKKDGYLANMGRLTQMINMWAAKDDSDTEVDSDIEIDSDTEDDLDILENNCTPDQEMQEAIDGLRRQAASTRIESLGKLLGDIKSRCIIFSSFTNHKEEVISYLERVYPGRCYLYVDGKMSQKKRERIISIFEEVDDADLFTTYKLGACGHNFQYCWNVIFLDMDWNASWEKQALARCLRRGQKNKVNAFELISDTTFEKIMTGKHKSKDILGDEYIKLGYGQESIPTLSLRNMVKKLHSEELSQTHTDLSRLRQGNRYREAPVYVEDLTGE